MPGGCGWTCSWRHSAWALPDARDFIRTVYNAPMQVFLGLIFPTRHSHKEKKPDRAPVVSAKVSPFQSQLADRRRGYTYADAMMAMADLIDSQLNGQRRQRSGRKTDPEITKRDDKWLGDFEAGQKKGSFDTEADFARHVKEEYGCVRKALARAQSGENLVNRLTADIHSFSFQNTAILCFLRNSRGWNWKSN